jgi:hypothetical protein
MARPESRLMMTKVPVNSLTLSDLYCTKFRIVQRLENNRLNFNFIKVKRKRILTDDDGRPPMKQDSETAEVVSSPPNKTIGGKKAFFVEETKISKSETENGPNIPFSRRRQNWDNCLEEVQATAYNMSQDTLYKMAECGNLCRKARKEVIKKESQSKGNLNFKKLLSAVIAYNVMNEFVMIKDQSKERPASKSVVNQVAISAGKLGT